MLYPYVRRWAICLIFTLCWIPVIARNPAHQSIFSCCQFHIKTLSFIKNSEYFNPFIEGETLAGYQLHPTIKCTSIENLTASLGVLMRKNWAEPKMFSLVAPTFRMKYQKYAHMFLMGHLKTQRWSDLVAPLYDTDRHLTNAPATGMQYAYANEGIHVDLWLHWLKLLDKKKQRPEELVAGLSVAPIVSALGPKVTLKFPLQLLLYHLGGQGIAMKDFTLWMGALGGCMDINFDEQGVVRQMGWYNYLLLNRYVKGVTRPFKTGYGWLSQLMISGNYWSVKGSYWHGVGFSSESIGHPLYQSVSLKNHQVIHQEKNRHLIRLELNWVYQLNKQFKAHLQFQPYYDLRHDLLEHEVGLYLHYTPFLGSDGGEYSSLQ